MNFYVIPNRKQTEMKKFCYPFIFISVLAVFLGCSSDSNDTDTEIIQPPVTAVDTTANRLRTGDSANDLLSNTEFDKIRVEIAYVSGFRPTSEAMTGFWAASFSAFGKTFCFHSAFPQLSVGVAL